MPIMGSVAPQQKWISSTVNFLLNKSRQKKSLLPNFRAIKSSIGLRVSSKKMRGMNPEGLRREKMFNTNLPSKLVPSPIKIKIMTSAQQVLKTKVRPKKKLTLVSFIVNGLKLSVLFKIWPSIALKQRRMRNA